MRVWNFIIFFSVFLLVYGLVNYYIFIRGWAALPARPGVRYAYAIVVFVLSLSFFFGRILERFTVCTASTTAIWIGSFWFACMLYLFIGFMCVDVARGFFAITGAYPLVLYKNPDLSRRIVSAILLIITIAVVASGYFNANTAHIKKLNIDIQGKKYGISSLNIVLVTDIHLGVIIGNSQLEKLVAMINGLNPDVVLFAGDIVDEDLRPVINQNLGATLCSVKARYGVFAVTGNHEFIGGVEPAVKYLGEHGITVLRDSAVKIDDAFYIVGRDDRSCESFSGKKRMRLSDIMADVDRRYPVILMDHQPLRLRNAAAEGVDLQLSGHTHHGQLWPFNYITKKIYEISWGYDYIHPTHFYVSCGFGTWGPPVRVGNRPEVVNIRVNFL